MRLLLDRADKWRGRLGGSFDKWIAGGRYREVYWSRRVRGSEFSC